MNGPHDDDAWAVETIGETEDPPEDRCPIGQACHVDTCAAQTFCKETRRREALASAAAARQLARAEASPHNGSDRLFGVKAGASRFWPTKIDDIKADGSPAWLIHGLLPARGLAVICGSPKSGKSFLTCDMLLAVARGVPYAGRAVLPGPVVYVSPEGVAGLKRRLVAMRQHYEIEGQDAPFCLVGDAPDLGSEKTNLPDLLDSLDAFLAAEGLAKPRAIVIDTLARTMSGADENSAGDMGRFIDRCGVIERHYDCVVVVVHHLGKNASAGPRGSNALNGAADVTFTVEKHTGFSAVRIDEMKDGPEGQEWSFRLVPFTLSATSIDGSATSTATTTCVVELLSEPTEAQPRATKKQRRPTGVVGDLLGIIETAVAECGEKNVSHPDVPHGVSAVFRGTLKQHCLAKGWQDEAAPNAFRAMFSRGLSQLRDRHFINFNREWVWLT